MPAMLQYAIYEDPEWAQPRIPYVVVPWLLDVSDTGKRTAMPMPAEGYVDLDEARMAVLLHGGIEHELTRMDRQPADEPELVEMYV